MKMTTIDERHLESSSINVIGLGHIGLITLFHLAKKGFHPTGVDIDENLVKNLKQEHIPFFEAEFSESLKKYHSCINFQTHFQNGKYWFICIPTPFDKSINKMNLSKLTSLLEQILTKSWSFSLKIESLTYLKNT